MGINIKFWGVRGSIPCCSPDYIVYGGNTSCVEIDFDDNVVILDCGTGIRSLGADLSRRAVTDIDLLISHFHWDHILGFPFFSPLYNPKSNIDVYGCVPHSCVEKALENQMAAPFFPCPLEQVPSNIRFLDIPAISNIMVGHGQVQVETAPLNHPNSAIGYRMSYQNKIIAYVSDTEHYPDKDDENVLSLMKDADVVIYDTTYTDKDYCKFVGWGHSTPSIGLELAKKANAKKLVLFHHNPAYTDKDLANFEQEIQKTSPTTIYAREGLVLNP
ncbi:MAG: MBL fold metallo-hydrolase [Alphaproteobacteria bacterium]|nr:MBL fold metallo-hydrolase [Alphaproteobacteria bacterium]